MADDIDYDAVDGTEGDEEFEEETFEAEQDPTVRPELHKLYSQHPELIVDYREAVADKIDLLAAPPGGDVVDSRHTTYPFMTIYERAAVIGFRANELSQGARPLIADIPDYVTDVKEIARMELEQKRLPYIIKRPLPDGTYEYWRVLDLLIL